MVSMNEASKLRALHTPDIKIFVKDVRDRHGKKRPLSVRSWSTIKDVKDQLQHLLHVPPSSQRLYFGPLMISGKELPNYRTLQDAGIYRSGETLLLDIKGGVVDDGSSASSMTSLRPSTSDVCVSSFMLDVTPRPLRRIVQQARRGFALGLKPDLVLDGTGGTYFLHDARKVKVAVFKPGDEEPYAENNPRGYVKQGIVGDSYEDVVSMREGIKPGESCLREVAAYLLDHDGFSGVPMTTLAEARHPAFNTNGARLKLSEGGAAVGSHSLTSPNSNSSCNMMKKMGSLQEYVNAERTMDDMSPSKLEVDEVHKIAILDIRLMNADRNSANLLCRRKMNGDSWELIPIDHGYCLRSVCDVSWFDWCWLDWPQLKKPLSKKSKEYILKMDVEADVLLLKERLHIGSEALDCFRASSKLLRAGVEMGLTLYDIAIMCCRHDNEGLVRSTLERITSQAAELATFAVENGKWHHVAASRALADQLTAQNLAKSIHGFLPNIGKSVSSTNFTSLSQSCEDYNAPARTATSGSDSSYGIGDDGLDQEECEEWAAAVIADVHIEDDVTENRRNRSSSFSSSASSSESDYSDKLSTSPVGFWYIRPGTNDSVDEEDSWSPTFSPRVSIAARPSLLRMSSSISSKPDVPPSGRRASVCFDIASEVDQQEFFLPPVPTSSQKMVRSQSYSALSSNNEKFPALSPLNLYHRSSVFPGGHVDDGLEQHHTYFLKFIDLLIEKGVRYHSADESGF